MMKKKIGFLANTDYSLYLFRLPVMQEMAKNGHKIYAICPKGDKNRALRESGFEVVNYKMSRKSLNPFKELKTIKNIYDAIKELNLDLLHTFTAKPNIYGTFAAKYLKVPIVLNLVEGLGSFYATDSLKNKMIRALIETLYKIVFKISDGCIFVNSDDPKYMLEQKVIPQNKITIIKSVGIDTDIFDMKLFSDTKLQKIKEKNGLRDKIIVLMVARAIWDKGVREFYIASDIVKKKYKNVEFVFAGDIDDGNPSCASREFLQNGSVKWLGRRDDILELTAISDICVLPSFREGVPRSLLEAASMSKPIIATDTVGCREVVENGKNGFLIPIKNAAALAEKAEILINDKKKMIKMGEEGRKKALREFDLKIVVKQYVKLYKAMFAKDVR